MGFAFIQNEQRVLHDMAIALMIALARQFGVRPESVQVNWLYEDSKWFPEVKLSERPKDTTDEQIQETIGSVYKEARPEIARMFAQNKMTRFHGP
jgi:hypothetical protein